MRYFSIEMIFFLLISLFTDKVFGQVIPPTPTSMQIAKYVNYPVSIENGIPDVKVPLYEIKVGKLRIPIELKYHASGIKFGQSNGEVGIGWVIDPSYRISRTIFGRPDEFYEKPFSSNNLPVFGTSVLRDAFLSNFVPRLIANDIPHSPNPVDGEFDMFNYVIPEGGGGFMMTDRVNNILTPVSLDNKKISFQRVLQKKDIDYFEIKDGEGRLYRFGKNLSGQKRYEEQLDKNSTPAVATAWMLTDIEDVLGSYMRINYKNAIVSETKEEAVFSIIQGGEGQWGDNYSQNHYPTSTNMYLSPQSTRLSEVQYVSDIETQDEKILFFRQTSGLYLLDSIRVERKDGLILKRIIFSYNSTPVHTFLLSVKIKGRTDQNINVWNFGYRDEPLLSRLNFVPDYWGYYKRIYTPSERFPDFGDVTYYETMGSSFYESRVAKDKGLRGIDRNADVTPDYFMLKTIQFPTGGSVEYIYEPNLYWGMRTNNGFGTKIAGVRIKKVILDDGRGNKISRRYSYGKNEEGSGFVNADIASNDFYITQVPYFDSGSSLYVKSYTKTYYNSHNASEVMLQAGGTAPVRYSQVVEYQENGNVTNGKTVYEYNISTGVNWNAYNSNITFPSSSYGWNNKRYPQYFIDHDNVNNLATLKSKLLYELKDGNYKPVRKEEFEYSILSTERLYGLKVRRFGEGNLNYVGRPDQFYTNGLHSLFDYSVYSVDIGAKQVTNKRTVQYQGGDSLVNMENYKYNPLFQLSNVELLTSTGDRAGTVKTYAGDFSDSSGPFSELQINNKLLPVEEVHYRFIGSDPYIVGGSIFNYHSGGKGLISKKYEFTSVSPTALTDFKFANTVIGKFPWLGARTSYGLDVKYLLNIDIPRYDNFGNHLEIKNKGGIVTSYLWGYNGLYPIAEIKNATYAEIVAVLGQATIDNLNLTTHTDATMETLIQNASSLLRTDSRLSKAMVTSYTYKPLVGMTSKTDARGVIEYYEYDGMQRLKAVLDQMKNVTSSMDYHYRPN